MSISKNKKICLLFHQQIVAKEAASKNTELSMPAASFLCAS
jgi:hypothetical protein